MGAQTVNNIGTNYTLYYNILDYFKTIMKNHPSLNFVSQGDMFSIDTKEFPAYPLGNVFIADAQFLEKNIVYKVQLTLADKVKDKNNESTGTANLQTIPFDGTDDTVDIHANMLSVMNDLLCFTRTGVNAFEFYGDPVAIPFKDNFDNGLAGWVVTLNLKVFNSCDTCLFPSLL
jgi:hypothetical protein